LGRACAIDSARNLFRQRQGDATDFFAGCGIA
jgi:hypothetical protein